MWQMFQHLTSLMLKIPKPLSLPEEPREYWMRRRLEEVKLELEVLINRTPTSTRRNELTDANIYLMHSIDKLKNVPSAASVPKTEGI